MDKPRDLIPLPTMPWDERPMELALTVEECRTAIWMCEGNISKAALLLKISSLRLRNFIKKSAYLTAEVAEAKEQLADTAEAVVAEALTDPDDSGRRDTMARFVLNSIGRSRGWGSQQSGGVAVKNSAGGTIIVQWGDGQAIVPDEPRTIEHENNITPKEDAA